MEIYIKYTNNKTSVSNITVDSKENLIVNIAETPEEVKTNDPQRSEKKKNNIFYVNNNWSYIYLRMDNPDDWILINNWVGRFRKIIDKCGTFRCEDLDMIFLNSKTISQREGFISGSTYVMDGHLNLFRESIAEIETTVISFRA